MSKFDQLYNQFNENMMHMDAAKQDLSDLSKERIDMVQEFSNEILNFIPLLTVSEMLDVIKQMNEAASIDNCMSEESATESSLIREIQELVYDEQREIIQFIEHLKKGHGIDYIKQSIESYLALSIFLPVFMNHLVDAEGAAYDEIMKIAQDDEASIVLKALQKYTELLRKYYQDSKIEQHIFEVADQY